MRQAARRIAAAIDGCILILLTAVLILNHQLPDSVSVMEGETFSISWPFLTCTEQPSGESRKLDFRLMGAVEVKTVEVSAAARKMVYVSGRPFGIRMFTDGLMVVGMSDVSGRDGRRNPAREAGLRVGDRILAVDGKTLTSNEELGRLVAESGGRELQVTFCRKEEEMTASVHPEQAVSDEKYRIGVWVRDSSAGIGTLTWYDPEQNQFTGLGHAVCDVDTGELMPLASGEAVEAEITGCKKGRSGSPGELRGRFLTGKTIGPLEDNRISGVYGNASESELMQKGEPYPVALRREVTPGYAEMLTTIHGTEPERYEIYIERVDLSEDSTRNLVIRVTDSRLLKQTGGIVQGMSGSPILQNGRLVGAVTHVFVNDPTRGYGIFIENMLDTVK